MALPLAAWHAGYESGVDGSVFSQQDVEHPAPTHMRPWRTEMVQDVSAIATRFFKGIGQNCNIIAVQFPTRQIAIFVRRLRELDNSAVVPSEPGGIDGNGSERVAENAIECPATWQINSTKAFEKPRRLLKPCFWQKGTVLGDYSGRL
jgi:hypothetical protein